MGRTTLPLTLNSGDVGTTFTCSPRIAYTDYTREELAQFPNQAMKHVLHGIVSTAGRGLRKARLDHIVHVNNWMMSTNLPVPLDTSLTSSQTDTLAQSYPDHVLAMRSLTKAQSAPLMHALRQAGWIMVPARQIFLLEDVDRDTQGHEDNRNDDRLWRRSSFAYEEPDTLTPEDAARVVTLYQMLYRQKYSRLNPDYTAAFVHMTQQIGMIRYLLLRDKDGKVQGFGGLHAFGNHATMPLIGYNTDLDRRLGLYRLVCRAGLLHAARHGRAYNKSSGAGPFKMNRGATPEMEYTAFFVQHLPRARQRPMAMLSWIANRIAAPLMERYHL